MQTALINNTPVYSNQWSTVTPVASQTKRFLRGEIIAVENTPGHQPCQLLAGEVVILRQGRPVDLLQPGEWLDQWGWPDSIAVAWSDAILATSS